MKPVKPERFKLGPIPPLRDYSIALPTVDAVERCVAAGPLVFRVITLIAGKPEVVLG
jgi:hypothetical protein